MTSGDVSFSGSGPGWSELDNGDLLDKAEKDGYEVLNTTDQNMRHQQSLSGRRLAIVVLLSTAWPDVRLRIEEIRASLIGIRPGDVKGSADLIRNWVGTA